MKDQMKVNIKAKGFHVNMKPINIEKAKNAYQPKTSTLDFVLVRVGA